MGRFGTTTDYSRIRHWIEARGGHPARIKNAPDSETVRVDFSSEPEEISWDEFFQGLDGSRLAFLHRTKAEDDVARFGKILRRKRLSTTNACRPNVCIGFGTTTWIKKDLKRDAH